MRVLKFGGSSVANAESVQKVFEIIQQALTQNDRICVVLSALGGVTNSLLEAVELSLNRDEKYIDIIEKITDRHVQLVKKLIPLQCQSTVLSGIKELCNEMEDICKGVFLVKELSPQTKDSICSYGEILSTKIFSKILESKGIPNVWCDSVKLIKTDSNYQKATADLEGTAMNLMDALSGIDSNCFIFPGFIGSNEEGKTTTLGRGGSDYTAAIIGAALEADVVEIWTDVSGMMTADPGMVKNARIIPEISYEEALELSHFGAKVIYPKTVAPLINTFIPILVKNTFAPQDMGTRISDEAKKNGNTIRGISSMNRVSMITLEGSGMIGSPGYSKKLFEALANEKINAIFITQSSSEYNISVAVEHGAAAQAKSAIDLNFLFEIQSGKVKPVHVENGLSIVALVGDTMKSRIGLSGKMFSALGRNGINVRAIAQGSSERNISAVISEADVKKAINVLHEEFFENTYKQINLYLCGTGNVGKKLLDQLNSQKEWLKEKMHLQLKVASLANSRKKLFSPDGIDLNSWKEELENGSTIDTSEFIETMIAENRRNSIFVDMTANAAIAEQYPSLLKKNISVVACNKIACSSTNEYYQQLKKLANRYNASFLFETNVGAGLPVIGTLNDLIRSGDQVVRIEAVLSGTLNFVFNNYDGSIPFAEVVRNAAAEGYTEPDPRLDLSGIDVMRKILILVRESGFEMEIDEIENEPFMPAACMEGDVESFYAEMEKHEDHFKSLVEDAHRNGKKLKYVAEFKNGKASTGLKQISTDHDFYHLYGKDNVVLFYTHRYTDQPLVIKGAGAGAEVTASGVFADILRASRS